MNPPEKEHFEIGRYYYWYLKKNHYYDQTELILDAYRWDRFVLARIRTSIWRRLERNLPLKIAALDEIENRVYIS